MVEVYLGLVDGGLDSNDPVLASVRSEITEADYRRICEQMKVEAETKIRRADAARMWLRRRIPQPNPDTNHKAQPQARPATLRIVDDFIELDHIRVARLLPHLSLSLLDRLIETFDSIDEDAAYIAELEEKLEAQAAGEEK
jgi:hypothetical protein